jgi:hypothetical protein
MAVLRLLCCDRVIVAWYLRRKAHKADVALKAVIAVMRKLARALWHVARGASFDPKKLVDVRRLDPESITLRSRHVFHAPPAAASAAAPYEGGAAIA